MIEWEAPGVILAIAPYGEGDVVATILTADHGAWRGLARGGASRARASTWQAGNIVEARWTGRLADHLGSYTGELAEAVAARAMAAPWSLAVMNAALSLTASALPEREPHPRLLAALLRVLASLSQGKMAAAELARMELILLADLGFALDLDRCAVTGVREDLAYVSPRTGRAVSRNAAGAYTGRLLKLPQFLHASQIPAEEGELNDALCLTGHFLARDVFGAQNRDLPAARHSLMQKLAS
jgi:DNA repair protein RecO (recombination protein O)